MPEKAWHANQRYAGLVTNIPHALHMPGHIYAQSDKIQEAISAFSAPPRQRAEMAGVRHALPERATTATTSTS
jgi:regulator of sirC expression with transglutaminase-like and TPR domain